MKPIAFLCGKTEEKSEAIWKHLVIDEQSVESLRALATRLEEEAALRAAAGLAANEEDAGE